VIMCVSSVSFSGCGCYFHALTHSTSYSNDLHCVILRLASVCTLCVCFLVDFCTARGPFFFMNVTPAQHDTPPPPLCSTIQAASPLPAPLYWALRGSPPSTFEGVATTGTVSALLLFPSPATMTRLFRRHGLATRPQSIGVPPPSLAPSSVEVATAVGSCARAGAAGHDRCDRAVGRRPAGDHQDGR